MSTTHSLIQTNLDALREGMELLGLLNQDQYTSGYKPAFHSTIGAHFRHFLEHYRCFFDHLDSAVICYDSRLREPTLESDIGHALVMIEQLRGELESLKERVVPQAIQVADDQSDGLLASTVDRELLFLQSHTTHHYAIIGALTRALGVQPAADFGVAIATRNHQNGLLDKVSEEPTEKSACAQ